MLGGRGGSGDSHESQYQRLESNASDYREPVEGAEERGYMGGREGLHGRKREGLHGRKRGVTWENVGRCCWSG